MFIVQDYVRVPGGNGGGTSDQGHYYSYNHDIDHPYFAHRPGFVRMKVKNQGLVATLGGEGKTRLTWLVNMDFGGMVPSAFVKGLLVGVMATPFVIVEQTKEHLGVRKGGDVADLAKSSSTQEDRDHVSQEAFEKMRDELKRAQMRAVVLRDELTLAQSTIAASLGEKEVELNGAVLDTKRDNVADEKLKAEVAEMKAEMARKDEDLRSKDEELKVMKAEVQELRRRLPRP